MFATPLFNGYDSDPYYFHYQPAYRRQQKRSSRNQQEERRQRYLLQQLQAAEEAQRRQVEAERHLQRINRQKYLQRLQEEEIFRRAYEDARRRREMEETQQQVREYSFGNDHEFSDSDEDKEAKEAVFRVIQGADGRLYKVKVGEKLRHQPQGSSRRNPTVMVASPQHDDGHRFVRGTDERTHPVQQQPKQEEMRQIKSWFSRANHIASDQTDEESSSEFAEGTPPPSSFASMRVPFGPPMTKKRSSDNCRPQKLTVLVEDASDSESEDECDPSAESWRNRLVPSPGESWMEPVKST